MSENTQILIRALEASGSQREADLARAILGDPAAPPAATPETPAAPEIPAAPLVPVPVAAVAEQQGPPPPPGKAPLLTVEDAEALPQEEFDVRYDEVQAVLQAGQQRWLSQKPRKPRGPTSRSRPRKPSGCVSRSRRTDRRR